MLMDTAMLEMLSSLGEPGEPNPLLEILEIYRDDGQMVLDRLKLAVAQEDTDGARRAAHRLKGSSANLGAVALSAVLAIVERDAPAGITAEIRARVDEAQALFMETVKSIEAHCRG